MRVNGEFLSNLRFADDIVLLTNSEEDLQQMIEDLFNERLLVGLKINLKKSKPMSNNQGENEPFMIGNKELTKL